ncbi:hypothetical protein H7J56_26005 [Mycolicibacterium murale]|uniref:hypothetical protein n=1 Tax=Mycolicibacterium murale TaxID=182220 RepID=UPI0021F281E0|nr:hypothetical protein [Mycolicibacterium murale]MCV7185411.1 hypothetical protein [Mycolicibacterium murale]
MIEDRLRTSDSFTTLLHIQQLDIGERVDRQAIHLRGQFFDLGQGSQHRLTVCDG